MTDDRPPTDEEAAAFARVVQLPHAQLSDLDIDQFGNGIIAHRRGLAFHQNPNRNGTVARLSWSTGWNERAIAKPR